MTFNLMVLCQVTFIYIALLTIQIVTKHFYVVIVLSSLKLEVVIFLSLINVKMAIVNC